MADLKLGWGCTKALPDDVTAAWGARLIFPDDLLYDRQDMQGDPDAVVELANWLNQGVLRTALCRARTLAQTHELSPISDEIVTLYEDESGIVKASPQSSSGYLYVAAWLK